MVMVVEIVLIVTTVVICVDVGQPEQLGRDLICHEQSLSISAWTSGSNGTW